MALSIKDPEADRLARRIAGLTGESLTMTVVTALNERLDRLERQRSARRLREDIAEIQRRFREAMTEPMTSTDHGDLLYDEHGLPK